MANEQKERIKGLKESLERAREKEQEEISRLRELISRREWLVAELAAIAEKMRSIIFLDPNEVAAHISRRNAIEAMIGTGNLEEQTLRYRIAAATNAVRNAERTLMDEELPLKEIRQREFAAR